MPDAPPSLLIPGARRRVASRAARIAPLALAGAVAFLGGAMAGSQHERTGDRAARAFMQAWAREDYPAMYEQLSAAARGRASLRRFARTYFEAAETLTLAGVRAGQVQRADDGGVTARISLRTRLFGQLSGELRLPVSDAKDGGGVEWRAHHVFPGLAPNQRLERTSTAPERGTLQSRDGTVLAGGPARIPDPDVATLAAEIVGGVGPAPLERAAELAQRGLPPDAQVGLNGLEREFDSRLAGAPGGDLRAGGRLIAQARPRKGATVRTTIDLRVQRAAITALAGRFGGVAVMHPITGEVLGLAGIAFSAPQPPGSTFKIVTLAAALEAGVAKRSSTFPVATSATLSGVELENANRESCGGSLRNSFAHSCNSVFGPIGAKLGAKRLVAAAEGFGFNGPAPFASAARSTLPAPEEIGDDLAVGSTAIGQGKVLSTVIQMASVAATIANRGERMLPTLLLRNRRPAGRVVSARVARTVTDYMRAVVAEGTGIAAAIPGVRVAGKTGTAELRTTQPDEQATPEPGATPVPEDTSDTNAWFAAFAPADKPRVAVAVLLVGQGAGGDTAAPLAREVLLAALERRG